MMDDLDPELLRPGARLRILEMPAKSQPAFRRLFEALEVRHAAEQGAMVDARGRLQVRELAVTSRRVATQTAALGSSRAQRKIVRHTLGRWSVE
jgi:hypothetical protein